MPTFKIREDYIPFSPPSIGSEEIEAVVETLKSDWITTGPKTRKFEEAFAAAYGSPASLALNSCTAGLHISLATLGVGSGDEVITVAHTFCSTCNVIEHLHAKPVLIDIEPQTMCMDPKLIEAAITSKTKAIMPVHYAGHPADMDAIQAIADAHGIPVIEDAAHPVGATYKGRFIGSGPNLTSFSFYATKNLTTAEGGMLTGDPELIKIAKELSLHGMNRDAITRYQKGGSWKYEVVSAGYKCNMTDIQAALGLVQLGKMDAIYARRKHISDYYSARFAGCAALETPYESPDVRSSWHLYVLRLNLDELRIGRDEFIEELKARNIGVSVHYIPIHLHPYYRDKYQLTGDTVPVTDANFYRIISLPLSTKISDEEIAYVADAVLDIVALNSK